ncbi:hypothetical protein [Planctomicrobium piriforme]|uniref:Uncharacterized protein n=1 Tax=Planctomicrobium piriforme TaxID=1576369 RepID=A0A1I3R8S9_9PLAN|nr:hypothetical protein [Planctomicrobium piriforme]SFJ42555.1 hypothetical protein SAMN05421753_12041 [Planctomicrobium piriforme]
MDAAVATILKCHPEWKVMLEYDPMLSAFKLTLELPQGKCIRKIPPAVLERSSQPGESSPLAMELRLIVAGIENSFLGAATSVPR